jgi:hypothetical protein
MSISPCNNLNVKTLRDSQLAEATSLSDNDYIRISQYGGSSGVYYSKKISPTVISSYLSTVASGQYSGSFSGAYDGTLNGNVTGALQGDVNLTSGVTGSITLAAAAGSDSGYYLPVKVGGTTYKILLYDNA